jgi:hypothetical protein
MGTLLSSLLELPWNVRVALYILTVLLTFLSGILYVRMGGQMMKDA